MKLAPERPLVVLFDIDGTLVLTGGAGRRAMRRAFAEVHGDATFLEQMDFRGMTDQRILRDAIEGSGGVPSDGLLAELLARYLELLAEELASSPRYTVMPGVMALVAALEAVEGVALGLGTGNVRRGAELKLAPCGLDRRLDFGGFGCDALERADLLRMGFERGAARLGVSYARSERVVVGDTPLDVRAAKAVGARTVAVCTGGHAMDELRGAGAEVVLEDLSVEGAVEAVLGLDLNELR